MSFNRVAGGKSREDQRGPKIREEKTLWWRVGGSEGEG